MQLMLAPLAKMKLTQPFGVNWTGQGDFYTRFGLKAHNGVDLSCVTGTELIAPIDGDLEQRQEAGGYGTYIRIFGGGLEVVMAHLQKALVPDGRVKAGDIIGLTNNTGASTGPHLHFGVRPIKADYNNGFNGYLDPEPFLSGDAFLTPVDKKYGQSDSASRRLSFAPHFLWFLRTFKRLPSLREYNALCYGFWPVRDVLDPAMVPVWEQMTYPAAKKANLVK